MSFFLTVNSRKAPPERNENKYYTRAKCRQEITVFGMCRHRALCASTIRRAIQLDRVELHYIPAGARVIRASAGCYDNSYTMYDARVFAVSARRHIFRSAFRDVSPNVL